MQPKSRRVIVSFHVIVDLFAQFCTKLHGNHRSSGQRAKQTICISLIGQMWMPRWVKPLKHSYWFINVFRFASKYSDRILLEFNSKYNWYKCYLNRDSTNDPWRRYFFLIYNDPQCPRELRSQCESVERQSSIQLRMSLRELLQCFSKGSCSLTLKFDSWEPCLDKCHLCLLRILLKPNSLRTRSARRILLGRLFFIIGQSVYFGYPKNLETFSTCVHKKLDLFPIMKRNYCLSIGRTTPAYDHIPPSDDTLIH